MRLVNADVGDAELRRLYNVWNLAMAPAEGREIAAVDKNMRMLKLMQSFLASLPTVAAPEFTPLTCTGCVHHDSDAPWPEICFECRRKNRKDMYHRELGQSESP